MSELHTPGPWRATPIGAAVMAGGRVVAHVADCPERKANALVMAAGPQLLAAVEIFLEIWDGEQFPDDVLVDMVQEEAAPLLRAAVAQARVN